MAKALGAIITFAVVGFLVFRLESKVKKVEKMCDKIREDNRLAVNITLNCSQLIKEYDVEALKVYNKLKPLLYQIDLGEHTIYLCQAMNEKSFLMVTIFGDSNLVSLNYKIEIDFNANKVKVFGLKDSKQSTIPLQLDFAFRLLRYCGVVK